MDAITHLSWISYLEFIAAALFLYYGFILFVYYRAELNTLAARFNPKEELENPFVFNSTDTEFAAALLREEPSVAYSPELTGDTGLLEAEATIAAIRAVAEQLGNEPHHPEAAQIKIKEVLHEHKTERLEPFRDTVNQVVVTACEEHGIALLREEDVDEWW